MNSLLIEIDKSQAEWVVVAYLAQDPRMIQVIEDNLSAHITTGKLISEAPEDSIKKEAKELGHETDPAKIKTWRKQNSPELLSASGFVPRNMVIRQMGKKSNHALNYDMSFKRFALENETPERDAKKITQAYYNVYPGIKHTFHAYVQQQLSINRTLTNCFGRKRRFLQPWGDDLFKEAYSFLPQSTVVDLINKALLYVYIEEMPMGNLELRIHNHDSLVLQIWYHEKEELYERCLRIVDALTPVLTYHNRSFTIDNEIKAGYSWSQMVELPHTNEHEFYTALKELEDMRMTQCGATEISSKHS